MTPETMRPMDETPQDVEHADPGVDKVLRSKRPARAEIRKMELSLILQEGAAPELIENIRQITCLLYTSPSPRDLSKSRMPSSA